MVRYSAIGIAIGSAAVIVSMLICAFILTLSDFNETVAEPMSNICLCIGAFIGGLFAALLHKSKGMIIGICVGFIMFLIITVVSLIVSGGGITLNTPLRLVIMSILGAVGGIVGVNRSAKRKMI